jgi:peptide deformylase
MTDTLKLRLRTDPDPVIRRVCDPVTDFAEAGMAAAQMTAIMKEKDGAGLAANQAGYTKRLFVMSANNDGVVDTVINPKILSTSDKEKTFKEACLSLPGVYVDIKRPIKIEVEYQNLKGEKVVRRLKHWAARVFQHELDHLDGICIDKK